MNFSTSNPVRSGVWRMRRLSKARTTCRSWCRGAKEEDHKVPAKHLHCTELFSVKIWLTFSPCAKIPSVYDETLRPGLVLNLFKCGLYEVVSHDKDGIRILVDDRTWWRIHAALTCCFKSSYHNPLYLLYCSELVDPNPKCMKMSRIQSEVHHHFCPKWVQWQDGVGRNWSQHSRRTGQRRANCGCRHTRPRLHKGGWASVAAENSPVVPISCQTHQSDPCLPNNWKVRVPEPWQLEMTWTCGKSEYLHLQWHGWRQFLEQFSTIYPAKSCKVQVWIT